jgi:hypothetical protein
VASDRVGNIYIPDGFGNDRVTKLDGNGKFLKRVVRAARAAQPGHFNLPLSIPMLRSTRRKIYTSLTECQRIIQVFNTEGAPPVAHRRGDGNSTAEDSGEHAMVALESRSVQRLLSASCGDRAAPLLPLLSRFLDLQKGLRRLSRRVNLTVN